MSDAAAVGILVGMMGTIVLLAIVYYVILAVAFWKIFTKAGEPGWKSLIPFYSSFIQYKISWNTMFFWIWIACFFVGSILSSMNSSIAIIGFLLNLAAAIVSWISWNKLSLAFGHGIGFTLGLIFLNPIFILILGLGSSEYLGIQNQ